MTTGRSSAEPDTVAQAITREPAPSAGRPLLSNIQALRALAVMLVLGYHLRPDLLTGGYVGVDVFFVISGYLMTAHLLRKTRPGDSVRVAVLDFYSRRIRRILPASLVVLATVSVVILVGVSRLQWHRDFSEIRASALYYENWSLASTATNYLAGSTTSPVQHFWSLSVEEQFYLGWPVFLALLGILLGRWGRRAQLIGITVVLVASLLYSVHVTQVNAPVAYFSTFARLWEFAVGGVVAWFGWLGRLKPWASAVLAWAGLAAIAYSVVEYTGATQFPGYLAGVPVLGAAALIAAGERAPLWGPQTVMRWPFVQYLGGISYSIYLWHLPLIELYPSAFGSAPDNKGRLAILIVSLALAAVTKPLIEDPFRKRSVGGSRTPRAALPFLACGAMMIVVVLIASGAISSVHSAEQQGQRAYAAVTEHPPACYGALTLNNAVPGCTARSVSLSSTVPNPFVATAGFDATCQQDGGLTAVHTCTFGSSSPTATRIAIVGDSHMTHWVPALRTLARTRNWRMTTYLKAGCALSTSTQLNDACVTWNRGVLSRLTRQRYQYVVVSARSAVFNDASGSVGGRVTGLVHAWRAVQAVGSTVIAIKDVPQPILVGRGLIPDCVYDHGAAACAFDRKRAERLDIIHRATAVDTSARLVDLTGSICPVTRCQVVVGKVLVYADDSHLTATYVRSMTPAIGAALTAAGLP